MSNNFFIGGNGAGLDKEDNVIAGTIEQYYRGDKTFQALDKTATGLGNVDNTSDIDKPISLITQTALNLKASQDTTYTKTEVDMSLLEKEILIEKGLSSQYWTGDKAWQVLNKESVGLSNVDNTSDINKPISLATQNALDNIQNISINGSMYFNNTASPFVLTLTLQNTYYKFTGFITGLVNGVNFNDGNKQLVIETNGNYKISFNASLSFDRNNKQLNVFVYKNNTLIQNSIGCVNQNGRGDIINISSQDNLTLVTGDVIDLRFSSVQGAGDAVSIYHANLTAILIG
jgi:hypothetical protein